MWTPAGLCRGDAMAWHPTKVRGSAGSGEQGSGKEEPQCIFPLRGGAGSLWGGSQRQQGVCSEESGSNMRLQSVRGSGPGKSQVWL